MLSVIFQSGFRGKKEGFGGVAIYVRDGLPFCVRDDLYSTVNECLWIELSRKKCRPTLICCAYRAPDSDFKEFISNLEIVLEKINLDKCDFVLLGDLNADMTAFTSTARKIGFTLNLILIKVEVKYDHSFDPNFDARQMCGKTVMSLPINLILDKEEVKFDLNFDSAFDAR